MADGHNTLQFSKPENVPDFDTYPVSRTLKTVRSEGRAVYVAWSDGTEHRYHAELLRENAPEAETTHPVTREQVINLLDLPKDVSAIDARITADGLLEVSWNWGNPTCFDPGWLSALAPGAEAFSLPERQVWTDGMRVPRFAARDVEDTVEGFEAFCTALHVWGAAIVEGLPATETTIETFPRKIGPIRDTNFGMFFDVINKPDADSNAYTTLGLPLHTDLPTREYMPGLQFLHCLQNDAQGGESTLADARRIGEALKTHDKDAFDTLATLPITFANTAKTTDYRVDAPFFEVDASGKVTGSRWATWLRGPFKGSFEDTDALYSALRKVFALGISPEMMVTERLNAGDMLAFDNRRVLHGRNAYDLSTGGRHLRGCYLEREELESRLRIIAREKRRAASL
ncbi:MAG: TauD/TfdA family dioxygenase [Pseudomonadota bacterium]